MCRFLREFSDNDVESSHDPAPRYFQELHGREVAVDGNVVMIGVGNKKRFDIIALSNPIAGFVFDAKGLMFDASLQGTKYAGIQ